MDREFSERLLALGFPPARVNGAILAGFPITTNDEGVPIEPSKTSELVVRQLADMGYLTYLINVGRIGDMPATSYFVISRDSSVWKDEFVQPNKHMHVALAFVNPEELLEPKFVFLYHKGGAVLPITPEQAERLL